MPLGLERRHRQPGCSDARMIAANRADESVLEQSLLAKPRSYVRKKSDRQIQLAGFDQPANTACDRSDIDPHRRRGFSQMAHQPGEERDLRDIGALNAEHAL